MTMLLRKNSHIIGASIIFWVLILSLICVRYVDIKYYKGKTKDFEPATMSHWRKYTLSLLGIAAVLWIVSAATGAGMIFK
ncbi:MAG: hypothetical protein JW795_02905 [Chitinivibrionales bacterium]|nr:hypothetical protein [Chitinivibrionales bacterium]